MEARPVFLLDYHCLLSSIKPHNVLGERIFNNVKSYLRSKRQTMRELLFAKCIWKLYVPMTPNNLLSWVLNNELKEVMISKPF
jgi:hypothetical protein